MSSLTEQVALNETALATLKSENESLKGKLALSTAEVNRLAADNDSLGAKLQTFIEGTSRMQTLLDSAGVLLIEGRKTGNALQGIPVPENRLGEKAETHNES